MAEKKVIEIDIESNLGSLKSQLREAQAEVAELANKFGATSDEAVKAAKKAAELKDAIGDAKALTDAYNPDAKFNALSTSIGGVLNGFQAYEGALGLLGVQSEDVQKTLLKVQSAMALTQGINGVLEAKESFLNLGKQVSTFGSSAIGAFQKMTTASKAFAITGIGLLLTGLTLVITYWDDISKAIGFTTDEQEKYSQKQKRINEQTKESREEVAKESGSFATLIARLKTTNEGTKEREDLIKKINSQYGTTLKNIKDETKFQEQLNNELASYLEYQKAKFQLQKNEEKIVKNLEVQDRLSNSIKDQKERVKAAGEIDILIKEKERLQKEIEQTGGATSNERKRVKQLQDEQLTLQKQIVSLKDKSGVLSLEQEQFALSNLNKELGNAEKRFEDYGRSANEASSKVDKLTNSGSKYVENNNEVKTSTIETNKELANTLESLTEKNKQYGLSEQELLKLNKLKTDALIEEQFLKSTDKDKEKQRTDALLANEIDYGNQLNALRKKEVSDLDTLKTTSAKDGIEKLVANKTTELQIEKDTADKKIAIEKEALEKSKQAQQQKIDLVLKYAQTFGQAMSSLNNLLNANDEQRLKSVKQGSKEEEAIKRKMFDRDKKLRIVQTVIDTASNIVTSVRNGGGIPTGIPFGVAAGVMGALQVAAISKAKFDGGGNIQSPSDAGGGFNPSFNVVGNSGINQLAGIQQQPVKAYITTGEVSTALSLERNTLQKTTF
jgi:hypothetical protein